MKKCKSQRPIISVTKGVQSEGVHLGTAARYGVPALVGRVRKISKPEGYTEHYGSSSDLPAKAGTPYPVPAIGSGSGKLAKHLRALLIGVALLILLPSTRAQELPTPGKEHERLKQLVGTWDAVTDYGKGTMTFTMGLGGLWLIGDFEGEFGGLKLQGKGLDTYDSATKKYRSVWVDSFTTGPRILEGNLDKDNKVMTMTGEGPGHDGKPGKFKSVTEFKDADTMNFTLFMLDKDGKEQPTVKITYKRKK
jgi:hypothetical protein